MCTVCRRNLLAGERFRYWQRGERPNALRIVCGLCEPSATREGWLRSRVEAGRENAVGLRGSVRRVA
jgi:hypothetical protein